MSNPITSGDLDAPKTFEDGDMTFTEDKHNEIIKEKLKHDKESRFRRFLRSVFHWSEPAPFCPVVLSDEEYHKKGIQCEEECLKLLEGPGWEKEKTGTQPGDLVEAMRHPSYGKIFKLTGVINCSPEILFKEVTVNLESITTWNPTILKLKIVKDINDETSLTYQVTTGGPKNTVKPRDFVCVRRISKSPTVLITSSVSIEHPECPPSDQYIRGHNNVGCWIVKPHPGGGADKCLFQWLMACDLKGWLPQYVLDIAFSTAQIDFLQYIRDHINKTFNAANA